MHESKRSMERKAIKEVNKALKDKEHKKEEEALQKEAKKLAPELGVSEYTALNYLRAQTHIDSTPKARIIKILRKCLRLPEQEKKLPHDYYGESAKKWKKP